MRQPIQFGKYLLLDRVSVGGMAEIFRAKSFGVQGFEKLIAIKRILPSMGEDREFIKMFVDEAKIAGQLSHPNIGQIFELGKIDGSHFIAMEYIWGKDLLQIHNRLRKRKSPMQVEMACYVVRRVLDGLAYAHKKRDTMGVPLEIVHRDCSPQNVLISYEGEVKLIDFGIAKAASRSAKTNAGVLKGKFGYMSPEQVRGLPLDRRSDIFAIGTILYESLTGARLFMGESDFSTLEKVRNAEVTPPTALNQHIPPGLERIVMRALSKSREDRYQWAEEMAADLQAFLTSRPTAFTSRGLGEALHGLFATEFERERALLDRYRHVRPESVEPLTPISEPATPLVSHLVPAGRAPSAEFEDNPTEIFGEIAEDQLPTTDDAEPVGHNVMVGAAESAHTASRNEAPLETVISPPEPPSQPGSFGAPGGPPLPADPTAGRGYAGPNAPTPSQYPRVGSGSYPRTDPRMRRSSEGSVTGAATFRDLPAPGRRVRRSSIASDIGVAIAIAVVVLGLFVGAKLLFFSDDGPARVAKEPARHGAIAIVINDGQSAEAWVDDRRVGSVSGDAPLTVDKLAPGPHSVRVERDGSSPCVREVDLSAARVEVVTCRFAAPAVGGTVKLEGLQEGERVFVDEQEISAEAAASPIALAPGFHRIRIRRVDSDEIVDEIDVSVKAGEEQIAKIERAAADEAIARDTERTVGVQPAGGGGGAAGGGRRDGQDGEGSGGDNDIGDDDEEVRAGGDDGGEVTEEGGPDGYLIAYTRPFARVFIDGVDTGKMTPISPSNKISLAPGKHRVTFRVSGGKRYDFSVSIASGKTLNFVRDLE